MSASMKRGCELLLVLSGNETTGVRNADLVKCLNASPATVMNDLLTLKDAGFVEEIPNIPKRWRLAPKMLQIALNYQRHMSQAMQRMDEFEQRVSREI